MDLQHGILSRWRSVSFGEAPPTTTHRPWRGCANTTSSLSERESIRWRSPIGNTVDLKFDRFASLADREILGLRCQITPIDFDGTIEIQSTINADPDNQGFDHWEQIDSLSERLRQRGKMEQGVWLQLRTRTSKIELGMAANMTAIGTDAITQVTNPLDSPTLTIAFNAAAGQTVGVEKVVTLFTSQDVGLPAQAAQTKLASLPAYGMLLDAHKMAWNQVWQQSDVEIEGDIQAQLAVRYNLFQLLISASPHITGNCSVLDESGGLECQTRTV